MDKKVKVMAKKLYRHSVKMLDVAEAYMNLMNYSFGDSVVKGKIIDLLSVSYRRYFYSTRV